MKLPKKCHNIEEVREAIDSIDAEILRFLGERYKYVKEIIKYKEPNKDSIIAKKRYDEVLAKRREWAEKEGLSADVIEEIYKILINYFIQEEISIINKNK